MKLNQEAIEEMNREDIFIFNRSGFTHTNEYSVALWAGDQTTDFGIHDGLPSAICAYNSSGLSGIAINHSDIGGYTAINLWPFKVLRDQDVFYRWTEMETFTPIFRTHEGLIPENITQFYSDSATQEFFAKMAKIHEDLYPLFRKYNEEASATGLPIVRHPYLEFPNDPNTYDLKYQFMLGDTLMVIPVIEANSNIVNGYLPEGRWKHYFTDETLDGGQFYEFDAPYGQPAVFWKLK
jgi:alpha-glucosidase